MTEAHGIAFAAARRQVHRCAWNGCRRTNRYGDRSHHGVVQLAHRERAHQNIDITCRDRLSARRNVVDRLGDKGDLGRVLALCCLVQMFDQAHALRTISTDFLEHGKLHGIAIDIVLQFSACAANCRGIHKDCRNASVDHCCLERPDTWHFKIVDQVAGWEH